MSTERRNHHNGEKKLPEARPARWITSHPDLVACIVDEILQEEVWWVAIRSRKHVHSTVVWADGDIPSTPRGVDPCPTARSLLPKTGENFGG